MIDLNNFFGKHLPHKVYLKTESEHTVVMGLAYCSACSITIVRYDSIHVSWTRQLDFKHQPAFSTSMDNSWEGLFLYDGYELLDDCSLS